jgi:hypothetical protein
MNEQVAAGLSLAVVESQDAVAAPKNTATSQDTKPAESGYADVSGLKLYAVSGKGRREDGGHSRAAQVPSGRLAGHHPHRDDAASELAGPHDHRFLGLRSEYDSTDVLIKSAAGTRMDG